METKSEILKRVFEEFILPESEQPAEINECSFCGKHRDQVNTLVICSSAGICDACVSIAAEIVADYFVEYKQCQK